MALPLTFGIASMSMGVNYIVKLNTLPAVVLALVLGSAIGELVKFEKGIFAAALGYLVAAIFIPQFIILIALFFSAALIMPISYLWTTFIM